MRECFVLVDGLVDGWLYKETQQVTSLLFSLVPINVLSRGGCLRGGSRRTHLSTLSNGPGVDVVEGRVDTEGPGRPIGAIELVDVGNDRFEVGYDSGGWCGSEGRRVCD